MNVEQIKLATRGLPYWMVRRHLTGGYTPVPSGIGNVPESMVSDPSYPTPWAALESIAPANRDKVFVIHAECEGTWIIGDLNDIAEGKHKE
jgi:hypothetical protein